jgi:hypothetical protein
MHAVVLAFGILAGACGSNTSSKEKLDAGQRKYCDAYCADASKDARTIDAGGGTVEVASEAVGAQPDATVYPDALVADVPIGADTAVQRLDARPGVEAEARPGRAVEALALVARRVFAQMRQSRICRTLLSTSRTPGPILRMRPATCLATVPMHLRTHPPTVTLR